MIRDTTEYLRFITDQTSSAELAHTRLGDLRRGYAEYNQGALSQAELDLLAQDLELAIRALRMERAAQSARKVVGWYLSSLPEIAQAEAQFRFYDQSNDVLRNGENYEY